MRKLLLLSAFLAATAACAGTTVSVTPSPSGLEVGGQEVPLTWTLDIADDGVSATIRNVTPKPFGEYEIPAVFMSGASVYTVKGIGASAFANAVGLTKVTVPPTAVEVGDFAFSNCTSLAEIELSYGVRRIGYRPFVNTMIRELELPDSLMDMDGSVGYGLANDLAFVIPDEESHFAVSSDGVLYDKDFRKLISCPTRQEQVIIPDTVTNIVREAFAGCFRLKSILVPENVTVVGDRAFSCVEAACVDGSSESRTQLKQVVFQSKTLTSVGESLFAGCSALEQVSFTGTSTALAVALAGVGPAVFADSSDFEVTLSAEVFEALEGAGRLADGTDGRTWNGKRVAEPNASASDVIVFSSEDSYGLKWCYQITNGVAVIYNEDADGNPVTAIDPKTRNNTYRYEYGADGVTVVASYPVLEIPTMLGGYPVKGLGPCALDGCGGVMELAMANTVTEIGDHAFRGCSGLIEIPLTERVRTLGKAPFEGTSIAKLSIPPSVSSIDGNVLLGCDNLATVTANGNAWFTVADGLLYDSEQRKLYGCPSVKASVALPASVTEIGEAAFGGCTRLESLTLPEGLRRIGASAFDGCTGLGEIIVPDAVTAVGASAFANCTGLASATIQCTNSVALGDGVFAGCSALKRVSIKGPEPTGDAFDAFYEGTDEGLVTTTKSADWTVATNSDGVAVWPVSGAMRAIELPGAPKPSTPGDGEDVPVSVVATNDVDGVSWTYASQDGEATVGGDGTAVPTDTEGEVSIPSRIANNDVVGISAAAFNNCSNVTSIAIPASVTEIEPGAFNGCTSLESFTVDPANPAYKAVDGVLYSKDGRTLVKVPALFTVACEATGRLHDYSRQEQQVPMRDGTWEVVTIRDLQEDVQMTIEPSIPMAQVLSGVTKVEDFAFTDCGFVRAGQPLNGSVTVTSNRVLQLSVTANGKQLGTPLANKSGGTQRFAGAVAAPMTAENATDVVTNFVRAASTEWTDASGVSHAASASTTFTRQESERTCTTELVFPSSIKDFTANAFAGSGFTKCPAVPSASSPGTSVSPSAPTLPGAGAESPDFSAASVYDGFVVRAGVLAGTIQLKAAKVDRRGFSKLTATVQLMGEKKASLRGESWSDGEAILTTTRGDRTLSVKLGRTGLEGVLDGSLEVVGARNLFSARGGDARTAAALARQAKTWKLALGTTSARGVGSAMAAGYSGLSLAIGAKGKTKVSGTLADGTRVNATAQMMVCDDTCYVPVLAQLYTGKSGGLGFVLRLLADGSAEVLGLSEWTAVSRTPFTAEVSVAALSSKASTPAGPRVTFEGELPDGYELSASDPWKGWNPRTTTATGVFKGSLSLYTTVGGKAKKSGVQVNGVVVDGVGYGSALVKGVCSLPVTVR